jgi:hypothetical protein
MADIGKSTKSTAPGFVPAAFGETGRKQFEAALAWLARAQSGVTLASELVGELATARTIPDAAAACQKCMNRQMEMFAENSRQMFADSEKLMRAGARLFTNGSPALSN